MRDPNGIFRRRSPRPLPSLYDVYSAIKGGKKINWIVVGCLILGVIVVLSQIHL